MTESSRTNTYIPIISNIQQAQSEKERMLCFAKKCFVNFLKACMANENYPEQKTWPKRYTFRIVTTYFQWRRMVQMFYYENRGQCARKILKHDGCKTKILLYPYEGWAQPASLTYWIIKTRWWSRTRCKIVQVTGTRKLSTTGKMITAPNGLVTVVGRFPSISHSTPSCASRPAITLAQPDPYRGAQGPGNPQDHHEDLYRDFKLVLSTSVSNADFQQGYSMTGTLERGCKKEGRLDMTHYAMVKRKGY